VQSSVALAQREILRDIAEGIVPADVADFSDLHDYTDANEYGGLCGDPFGSAYHDSHEEWSAFCADVQDQIHAWLVAGRVDVTDYMITSADGSRAAVIAATAPIWAAAEFMGDTWGWSLSLGTGRTRTDAHGTHALPDVAPTITMNGRVVATFGVAL
jgi:hypothetical protein